MMGAMMGPKQTRPAVSLLPQTKRTYRFRQRGNGNESTQLARPR
jgi:hypothetical protein